MLKFITWSAITATLLLFLATSLLAYKNWNQEVFAKVISGVLLGTATVFVFIYFPLKERKIERSFSTSLVIDEQQGLPLFAPPTTSNQKVNSRLMEIKFLSSPTKGTGKEITTLVKKPTDFNGTIKFFGDLLQYKLVNDLIRTRGSQWIIQGDTTIQGTETGATFISGFKTSDAKEFDGSKILKIYEKNQFTQGDLEKTKWQNINLSVPEGAEFRLEGPHLGRVLSLAFRR